MPPLYFTASDDDGLRVRRTAGQSDIRHGTWLGEVAGWKTGGKAAFRERQERSLRFHFRPGGRKRSISAAAEKSGSRKLRIWLLVSYITGEEMRATASDRKTGREDCLHAFRFSSRFSGMERNFACISGSAGYDGIDCNAFCR